MVGSLRRSVTCRHSVMRWLPVLILSNGLATGQIPFEHVTIDDSGPTQMHAKTVGDFNNDGFIDLVATGTNGLIYWYEYPDWDRHTIATDGGSWGTDAESGDLDNDNDLDLVISDYFLNDQIVWYENPLPSGDPRTDAWIQHVVGSPKAHDIELGDLDHDNDLDIVTRQQYSAGDEIVLWRQDTPTSWSKRTIATLAGEGLHLGDIDRDEDLDILIGGRWYENTGDILNGPWQEWVFAPDWSHAETFPWLGDINGDSRPDVVLTPTEFAGDFYRTSWYEAPLDPLHGIWTEHVIEEPIETVTHGLGLGDMNHDGALDVVTAEMHQGQDPDEVRVYINEQKDGLSWVKQVVDVTGSHDIRVIDVGNDGDLDIFGANWSNTTVVDLWENRLDPIPVFGETIVAVDADHLAWTTPVNVFYVKGDLASVGDYAVSNQAWSFGASSLDISGDSPEPGNGLYYLMRYLVGGSWQTYPGAEPRRDVVLP